MQVEAHQMFLRTMKTLKGLIILQRLMKSNRFGWQ